jgi:hypothetical protein
MTGTACHPDRRERSCFIKDKVPPYDVGSNTAIFSNNGNLSIHVNGSGILQGDVNAGLMLMF